MLVLFQKSAKSLQLVLNELSLHVLFHSTISNSAFGQARLRLKHTAFIELNQKAIVEVRYEDNSYQTWKSHRVLAVDGMQVPLPDSESVRIEFGTQRVANQHKSCQGEYPFQNIWRKLENSIRNIGERVHKLRDITKEMCVRKITSFTEV